MKIRDSILVVLAAGIVVTSASLVGFAASEIKKIEGVTSESSSDVLIGTANDTLENIAIGIRDSLDSQMKNQYDMVRSWAKTPTLVDASRAAKDKSLDAVFEMWSREKGRSFKDGIAKGDGDPDNDLAPEASHYLIDLSKSLAYPELFSTDARGYVVAASGATGDFDQGADDQCFFEGKGFKQNKPEPGGELWYKQTNEAKDGLYVGPVKWDASAKSWGIEIVSQIRDPKGDGYLGQLKAVFDYGKFIYGFVSANDQDLFEVKVIDQKGTVVATSLSNKDKVNNKNVILDQTEYMQAIKAGKSSGHNAGAATDENGEAIFAGFAVSKDVNHHAVVITKKQAVIQQPIDAFVGQLAGKISQAGQDLRQNMLFVASIAAALAFLLAWILLKTKITVPIAKLTRVSEKLAQGDIEGLQIDVSGDDEIGRFGDSFKGVLAAFNLLMEEAEKNRK
jgi:hypothetical protein